MQQANGDKIEYLIYNAKKQEKKDRYFWSAFILAIIIAIAIIIVFSAQSPNSAQYYNNIKYGQQRRYSQWVLWNPDRHRNSENVLEDKKIPVGQFRTQTITFPMPNKNQYIISYSATCQGNYEQDNNNGFNIDLEKPLIFVSNCTAVAPNKCIVTVGCLGKEGRSCPYGLYVTATYVKPESKNANGDQLSNNLTLNEEYNNYALDIKYSIEKSSIPYFVDAVYTPPKKN